MSMTKESLATEPSRAEIDRLAGAVMVEFGASWCGICAAAQPLIASAFSSVDAVRHLKIEDGKGRPLGRSFGVKLWPTLVFLRDGVEVGRLVRPQGEESIRRELARLTSAG